LVAVLRESAKSLVLKGVKETEEMLNDDCKSRFEEESDR